MTPGECRRGGEGLVIQWGVHSTPVGDALIATTARGVCAIHFLKAAGRPAAEVEHLRSDWPKARLERDDRGTEAIAAEISGRMLGRADQPLAVMLAGTPFQVKVWQALLAIPAGAVTSYSEIAARVGRPRGQRAAASAIGANRIGYLIPCHRVLRATGALGGYRWGEARKRALLALDHRSRPGQF